MTNLRRRSGVPVAIAIALMLTPAIAGCSIAENIVGGVVGEAQGQLDDIVSETLGGAGISTDGELPPGFPTEQVPVTGTIEGGGAGPDSSGWVVRTTLTGDEQFTTAQTALEDAGYVGTAVNSDADSGFGTFTLDTLTVVLTVATDADGVMTATYVVTPQV